MSNERIKRMSEYSAKRKTVRRLDTDSVHIFDIWPDGSYELRLSDIDWAIRRISELESWVKQDGINSDTCTRHILGKVCDNCRCKHAPAF